MMKDGEERWKENSAAVMTELATVIEGIDDFSVENQEAVVMAWIEAKGYKLGDDECVPSGSRRHR